MCRVNTFLVFPDQLHSGQLKPSREDDAGALETEVEGKGSVADPAKLTFVSLEHLEKIILPKKVNSLFVELFHMVCKVLLADKGLLALVAEERGRGQRAVFQGIGEVSTIAGTITLTLWHLPKMLWIKGLTQMKRSSKTLKVTYLGLLTLGHVIFAGCSRSKDLSTVVAAR